MFAGASTADAALVLIDARKGVVTQTHRHAHIAALLGIEHIVVCVNKMDLVGGYRGPVRAPARSRLETRWSFCLPACRPPSPTSTPG
jgi:translation elongation factor EF-G